MSELDPITGPANTTLTLPVLAERVAMERALREQGTLFAKEALELQATEYERRLDALNGEAGRLAKVLDQSVPREVYEAYVKATEKEHSVAIDALSTRIDTERSARIRLEGSLSTWRFIVTFLGLGGVVALLLGLIAVFGPK